MARSDDTLPELIDLTVHAGRVRTGLLAHRVANIFVSAALFSLSLVAILLLGLSFALAEEGGPPGPGLLDFAAQTVIAPALAVAVVVGLPFGFYRYRLARIGGLVIAALPLLAMALFGALRTGVSLWYLAVIGVDETAPYILGLDQGLTFLVCAALYAAVPLSLLGTLRMPDRDFAVSWRMGRAPLQLLATPGWFRFLGPGRWIAYGLYWVLNGIFCLTLSYFYLEVLRSAFLLEAAYAADLADPEGIGSAGIQGERFGSLLVLFLLVLGAAGLLKAARWVAAHFVPVLERRDRRAPILFLRGFADDQVFLGKLKLNRLVRLLTLESYPPNLDAMLFDAAASAGPVLAIENPDDATTKVGAARLRVSTAGWQEDVIARMREARRILIVVEATPGALWELQQILADPVLTAKTVFVKSPKSRVEQTVLPEPEIAAEGASEPLQGLFAHPAVFAVEMTGGAAPPRPARAFAARYPDALEYQCLLRCLFRPGLAIG